MSSHLPRPAVAGLWLSSRMCASMGWRQEDLTLQGAAHVSPGPRGRFYVACWRMRLDEAAVPVGDFSSVDVPGCGRRNKQASSVSPTTTTTTASTGSSLSFRDELLRFSHWCLTVLRVSLFAWQTSELLTRRHHVFPLGGCCVCVSFSLFKCKWAGVTVEPGLRYRSPWGDVPLGGCRTLSCAKGRKHLRI